MSIQRPTSIQEALSRCQSLHKRLESHSQSILPQDAMREAGLLVNWLDLEGIARRIHTLLCLLEEHLANLENTPDAAFSLLLAASEQSAQLADAIFAVEALEYRLTKHDLAKALAEQAAIKSAPKDSASTHMNHNEPASAEQEVLQ